MDYLPYKNFEKTMKGIHKLFLANPLIMITEVSFADWIKNSISKDKTKIIQLRHHIHQNPERGNMEFKTSKLVQVIPYLLLMLHYSFQ